MPTPKGRLRLAAANRAAPPQEPPLASQPSQPFGSSQPSPPTIEDAFRRYAPLVASVALRLSGDASDTDDVVQEVFLRATSGIRGLRNYAAMKAWLMSITINVLRHRLRHRRLRQFVGLDQPAEYGELVDPSLSPEDQLLVAQTYRALDRLPVNQRLAWTLRHIEGERLEAVALLCDCSLATAKRRIAAADRRIRKYVE